MNTKYRSDQRGWWYKYVLSYDGAWQLRQTIAPSQLSQQKEAIIGTLITQYLSPFAETIDTHRSQLAQVVSTFMTTYFASEQTERDELLKMPAWQRRRLNDIRYIRANIEDKSMRQLAEDLDRSKTHIYSIIISENLDPDGSIRQQWIKVNNANNKHRRKSGNFTVRQDKIIRSYISGEISREAMISMIKGHNEESIMHRLKLINNGLKRASKRRTTLSDILKNAG